MFHTFFYCYFKQVNVFGYIHVLFKVTDFANSMQQNWYEKRDQIR